jgi:hypothetical protein
MTTYTVTATEGGILRESRHGLDAATKTRAVKVMTKTYPLAFIKATKEPATAPKTK